MGKALGTKLYYSIGEVADLTSLAPYTLRAWEGEFACLRPKRVRGKNRAYRERDIAIILLIRRLLHEERYSTRGAQQKLRNEPELIRGAIEHVGRLRDDAPPSLEELTAAGRGPAGPADVPSAPAAAAQDNAGPAVTAPEAAASARSSDTSSSDAGGRQLLQDVREELREILRLLQ